VCIGYDTALAGRVDGDSKQIAQGLRGRDEELIDALVGSYQARLIRYLTFLLGRREMAEDVAQETWLRVLERGHTYDGRSRFEPWLFAIARNLAVDRLRQRRVLSFESDGEADGRAGVAPPVSDAPSPFTQAARTEDAQRLARLLDTLDPQYREALALRFLEELSLEEVSTVVGAPVSTVASRIYRGLSALRSQLNGGK